MSTAFERVGQRSRRKLGYARGWLRGVFSGGGLQASPLETEGSSLSEGKLDPSPNLQQHELKTPDVSAQYIRAIKAACDRRRLYATLTEGPEQTHLLAWASAMDWRAVEIEAMTQ